jgi:hypothetical protein
MSRSKFRYGKEFVSASTPSTPLSCPRRFNRLRASAFLPPSNAWKRRQFRDFPIGVDRSYSAQVAFSLRKSHPAHAGLKVQVQQRQLELEQAASLSARRAIFSWFVQ